MENKVVVALKGIVLHQGRILLLQRSDEDDIGSGTWECVGGKLEFGEDLRESLEREILEEAGISVKAGKLLYATTFKTHEWRQVVILTYLCTTQNSDVVLSLEHKNSKWATAREAKNLLSKPIFDDIKKNSVFEMIGLE